MIVDRYVWRDRKWHLDAAASEHMVTVKSGAVCEYRPTVCPTCGNEYCGNVPCKSRVGKNPGAKLMSYIVWNPTSILPPKVVHDDRAKAIQVAGRMSHENPGQTFYVCKLVNSATKPISPAVKYEDLEK